MRLLILLMLLPLILHAQEVTKVELGVLGCEDGSRWYGFSFTAQAGCAYELQSSTDLQHWTTEDSFMGWGESHPVLMKAMPQPVAAASLPAGAIPTPRPRLPVVRLLMRPATGGGLVLSWLSLDDGTPRNWCFPNFTLSVGWQVVPGYIRRFTSHEFLISSPQLAQAPPAVNPSLGVRDGAMIAEFETRFPAMQAEVAALLERMVAQPFAATMPTERKFYRLVVESEVDTDGDGTPDRLEFKQLFERAAGNFSIGGPAPDPFDGDTDGNGLADGEERSSDGDSISDGMDAAPEDERVDWRKLPPYRYALFPLPEGAVLEGDLKGTPLQTCDSGNVLYSYRNQLFVGGLLKTLPEPTEMNRSETGIYSHGLNMKAVALDDTGSAYAVGQTILRADGQDHAITGLIDWSPTGEHPGWLRNGEDYLRGIDTYESFGTAPDMFIPTRIGGGNQERSFLGFSGRLIADPPSEAAPHSSYHDDDGLLWTVSGVKGNGPPTMGSSARPAYPAHTIAPDGSRFGYEEEQDYFVGGHHFGMSVPRVVRLPSDQLMAIKSSGPPMIRRDGEWREAKSFKETVVDVSAGTGFVFHKFDGKAWQNGRVMEIKDWAPGSHPKSQFTLIDAAPAGPFIASYTSGFIHSSPEHVLGLPLCVEGVDTSVSPPKNNDLSAGVDSISIQAFSGSAKQNEMWIMAPTGGGTPNTVRFLSASNGTNSLGLTSFAASFDNGSTASGQPKNHLVAKDQLMKVSGTGTETRDYSTTLQLSGSTRNALHSIVKVKSMKKRTVKVALHKVIGLDEHDHQTSPILFPEESVLEAYLDKVYGRQVNTFFDVTVYEERGPDKANNAEEGIDFDFAGDINDLKINTLMDDPEVEAATPNARAAGEQPAAHIDVWVIGGGVKLMLAGERVLGVYITKDGKEKILIDGEKFEISGSETEHKAGLLHTIAHEIGHQMIGRGHADCIGDPLEQGPAILQWTESSLGSGKGAAADTRDRKRLMCSGKNIERGATQLVKKEWDLIEAWAKEQEAKNKLPLTP